MYVKHNIFHHINFVIIIMRLLQHKYLLGQLIKRDVILRYRGAYFGLLWIFLSPLIMLGIFAFVFGHIFQARWPEQVGGIPFTLNLFCGLIAFNFLADTVGRAPEAVRGYPNYVKKIIFPVEILPIVPLGSALVHVFFNITILAVALGLTGHLNPFLLLFPLLLLPIILAGMGISWFLAAWGVFIKDMRQIVPMFLQMLMFLSPVFYPAHVVPKALMPLYKLNPLGTVIEALRAALAGTIINWHSWCIAFVFSLGLFLLGYAYFNYSRDEFADAL